VVLTLLGASPVEYPFVLISQLLRLGYFICLRCYMFLARWAL
jgi:hypothetical protein